MKYPLRNPVNWKLKGFVLRLWNEEQGEFGLAAFQQTGMASALVAAIADILLIDIAVAGLQFADKGDFGILPEPSSLYSPTLYESTASNNSASFPKRRNVEHRFIRSALSSESACAFVRLQVSFSPGRSLWP